MNDLISRQAVIDYFVINVGFHDEDGYPIEDTDELRKIWTEYFDGIPSAQPKRGKWHYSDGKPARIGMSFGVICDQCGTESEYCTNFCGECGADMRTTVPPECEGDCGWCKPTVIEKCKGVTE